MEHSEGKIEIIKDTYGEGISWNLHIIGQPKIVNLGEVYSFEDAHRLALVWNFCGPISNEDLEATGILSMRCLVGGWKKKQGQLKDLQTQLDHEREVKEELIQMIKTTSYGLREKGMLNAAKCIDKRLEAIQAHSRILE